MKLSIIRLGKSAIIASSIIALDSAMPVAAQNASTTNVSTVGIPEVVVTARKEKELLQNVPMSVTAISGETLQESGAVSLADIGREVAGLNVVDVGPGQNELVIRGISSSGGAPTVGYYIDDTPIESIGNLAGNAMDPALYDLDRVEVLRGPQGTLYGASSMGGTVKYITKQPNMVQQQISTDARLSDTEDGGFNYDFSGVLNEPIVLDRVAVRAVAFYRDEDGYIDRYLIDPNNYLAAIGSAVARNVNTERTYGGRVKLKVAVNDALSITPSIWFQRTELGGPSTFDEPPGSFDHPIQNRDVAEPITDQMTLYSVTVNGSVGGLQITSSTAYRDRRFDVITDASGGNCYYLCPAPQTYVYPLPFAVDFGNHDFTEEIRASKDAGIVHGIVGLFYMHQQNHEGNNAPIPEGYNIAFGTPFGDQPFYVSNDFHLVKQEAVYGELNLDATKSLQLTLGLRAFRINQGDAAATTGVFNGGSTAQTGSSRDTGTTPKFEISYHVTDDALTYLSATKGFRQGGPLGPIPASLCGADLDALGFSSPPESFGADTLWDYEVGTKTSWSQRRMLLNADAYYIDWSHIQQLVTLPTCGFDFTGNFGKAVSKGGEIELQLEPVPRLLLTAALAYNEAQLTETVPGAQGVAGEALENAPRWMGSTSLDYRQPLSAAMIGYLRLDFSSTSRQYNNFDMTSNYYARGGYSIGNIHIGVMRKGWDVSLFVDNVLNKHAETALPSSYAVDLPTTRRLSLNRPRTVGLQAHADF